MSPPNVLITKYGEMKIVDFGLARGHKAQKKQARDHQG
jgi:serine/threonine protein kinase